MRRWLVVFLLCILVVSAVVAYMVTIPSPSPSPTPARVNVGIFYYVWYADGSGVSWNRSKIPDQPILGYYNSSDPAVIIQHILWMRELGVDFVVVSWWGFYDDYGKFTDDTAKQVFEVAAALGAHVCS
jgi:hypothetical protein